jgi:ribosomal protein S18 acetylase RimI-like enzyme
MAGRDYLSVFQDSGLTRIHSEAPLATGDEGIEWKSETEIAPWRTYVLQKSTGLLLRRAARGDLNVLMDWIKNGHECMTWAGPKIRFPFTIDSLCEDIQFDSGNVYCLQNARNEIVGLGQIVLVESKHVHLARIIICPELRGKQLGGLLCTALIRKGYSKHGKITMTLRVQKKNSRAIHLYGKLGFTIPQDNEMEESDENSHLMVLRVGGLIPQETDNFL